MSGRTTLNIMAWAVISGLFAVMALHAQTARLSGALVLRSQAGSVADETLVKIAGSLKGVDRVRLSIEGGSFRALIENAFLESLNRRGIHGVLQGAQGGWDRAIQIIVLDQGVRYVNLPSGEYRRDVQTSIEARDIARDSSSTQYLGTFSRSDIDTVAFREEIGLVPLSREGERTLFDKLVGPVVLIGGAFLIIYLFFTVRN